MKNLCYALLALFLLAPASAVAQDSVHVAIGGIEYPAYVAAWTPSFQPEVTWGPETLVEADPWFACEEIQNAAEIEGNVAFTSRGDCTFVLKTQNSFAAGAIANIIANNDTANPDAIIPMGGTWDPTTNIPTMMVSYNAGQAILQSLKFGDDQIEIIPIRIAPVPTGATLDTGVAETALFDNGFVADSPGYLGSPGFTFDGENGFYIASLLIGRDGAVAGDPYGSSEFVTVDAVEAIPAPFPAPYQGFDQGFTTTYDSEDIGVRVTANAYARNGDAFVIFEFMVENTTGGSLDGVYVGLFGDIDVGSAAENLGGFDAETGLVYLYDAAAEEPSANYFGMAALGDNVSGWTIATDAAASEESLWETMTTEGTILETPADQRPVVAMGPFDLSDEAATARFALVAGGDEASIIASAEEAKGLVNSVEESTPQGTYVLESAYPNPFTSQARIGFELPVAERVTLKVYDVLGREVATLVDGTVSAGQQSVVFDAANLPSGVYIYRLDAGSTQLVQRVTLVR